MSITNRHLDLEKRHFGRGHAIVITLAVLAALIAAPFAVPPAGAPLGPRDAASEAYATQIARDRAAARMCRVRLVPTDSRCRALELLSASGDAGAGL
jgi:hypothetical protein